MNPKTIIASDPDERAVVALEGVGDRARFRLDKVAFEWRGSAALKPFAFALDLRGGSLDDEERTASLDVPAAVASTLRAAALELDAEAAAKAAKAAKSSDGGAAPRPAEPSVAFRKRLVKTFAVALQALALDLTDELDAETAVKIALRTVDEGASGAVETSGGNSASKAREVKETGAREASKANEASGAGAFQAEKAKAFAAKFRADAKEAVEARGSERASDAKEVREEGGAR